jgi:hypothetical protein
MSAMTQMMEMMSLGVAGTPYNTAMAATAPDLWWRQDQTSGVTEPDNSAGATYPGSLTSGGNFSTAGVSIAAPSGFAGLGNGIDWSVMTAAGTTNKFLQTTVPSGFFGGNSASSWAIGLWVAGNSKASKYLASRVNNAAVIYQFVTDKVEFFALGYTGTNPRTGSQITLLGSDTTTPHYIVYRYNAGNWCGFLDGVKVFNLTASFGLVASTLFYLNTDSSSGGTAGVARNFDTHVWQRAPSDAEIASIWASRNNP